MKFRHFLIFACLGILAACSNQSPPRTEASPPARSAALSPHADSILRRVGTTLSQTHSLAFNVDVLREVQMADGRRVNLVSHDTVAIRRPDRLRADLRGDANVSNIYYDGKRVVVEELTSNLYAAVNAPPDINGTIDMLQDRLGVPLTIGALLRTDAHRRITENTTGDVVASSILDGRPVDHLLMTSGALTWELWVTQGEHGLPLMLVTNRDGLRTVYKFSDWRLNPAIREDVFHYTPRRGAHEIPFVPLRADQRS